MAGHRNDSADPGAGVCFDVLDVPAPAGFEVLPCFPRTGPVALDGLRARFLVAVGGTLLRCRGC